MKRPKSLEQGASRSASAIRFEHPKSIRVLLADQDPERAALLRVGLEEAVDIPITVLPIHAAEEALRAERATFDVLIISLSPGQVWHESVAALLLLFPDVPVIVIGGDTVLDPAACLERGVQEHIPRRFASFARVASSLHWAAERSRHMKLLEAMRPPEFESATRDGLTGLPNRVLFDERLAQLLVQARRRQLSFAVMFLDIDRFKRINDTLGHCSGDLLLLEVARRLESCLRSNDTVARWGGDEFAVLLDGISGTSAAALVADKIQKQMAAPLWIEGRELICSVSIGIAVFPSGAKTPEAIMRQADTAMYRAKSTGGGHRFFDAHMHDRTIERRALEVALREAIQARDLVLHYQPRWDLLESRLVGFEAQINWTHARLGAVPPSQLALVAEETALALPLAEWAMEAACEQVAAWRAADLATVPVSINVPFRASQHDGFVSAVETIVKRTCLVPKHLELALSVNTLMQDPVDTMRVLERLSTMEVLTSIDHFRTEFSSMTRLRNFPASRLKIDRSFISLILEDERTATMTRTIIDMAHCLGMRTVADGVEHTDQLPMLQGLGCDEGQGRLFATAQSAATASQFLRSPRSMMDSVTRRSEGGGAGPIHEPRPGNREGWG